MQGRAVPRRDRESGTCSYQPINQPLSIRVVVCRFRRIRLNSSRRREILLGLSSLGKNKSSREVSFRATNSKMSWLRSLRAQVLLRRGFRFEVQHVSSVDHHHKMTPSFARRFSTVGKPIECLAAVAWKPETDFSKPALSLEKITVAPPKDNEVRIRIDYSTLCGTDLQAAAGKDNEAHFPFVPGHESAGTVESIGPGVTTVRPGDKVVPCYQAQCFADDLSKDHCPRCRGYRKGKTNLCGKVRGFTGAGVMRAGGVRFQGGANSQQELNHFMGISCFSQYTVIHEESAGKIRDDSPLQKAPLVSCALPTGFGAVMNTAKVEAGSSVAVFGLGTVGLSIIEACKRVGATRIIGIDVNPEKFQRALAWGATDTVNPKEFPDEKIQDVIIKMTNGGVDYSFEATGHVDIMRAALECAHIGWGKSVVVGVAAGGAEISTRPFQLVTGRTWTGTAFGGFRGREGVAQLMDDYMDGKFDIDPYITHNVPLRDINEAFRLLRAGESLRTIIWMHEDPPHIGAVPA